jgi:hypothetical protein
VWADYWSATARIDTPIGELLVHGVVLPYMNEPGKDGERVPGWSRFMEELGHQADHWRHLVADYPAIPIVVAGDMNQNLDGGRWYGSRQTRHALREALTAAGLKCLTAEDVVAARKLNRSHLVDHICTSDGLALVGGISCWESVMDGLRMSDHPGVSVRLSRQPEEMPDLASHGTLED